MAFAATAAALAIAAGAAVPEPATWAMMITGFGAAAAMMRLAGPACARPILPDPFVSVRVVSWLKTLSALKLPMPPPSALPTPPAPSGPERIRLVVSCSHYPERGSPPPPTALQPACAGFGGRSP